MKRLIALLFLLSLAVPAFAQPRIVTLFGAANAVWYNTPTSLPADYEAGLTARASLSPHLSLVSSGLYGFQHVYLRGSTGIRMTATDVDNPNFAIGLGIQYAYSSDHQLRPAEWTPDVTLGFRPWPEKWPKVVLGAQGAYGLLSQQAYMTAAVRYRIDFQGARPL